MRSRNTYKRQKQKRVFLRSLKRLVRVFIILVFILLPFFGFYTLITKTTYFDVSQVIVVGTKSFVNEADVLTLVNEQVVEENIIFLDLEAVQKILKDNFLGAKEIKVTRQFPNKVVVAVVERVPLALVSNKNNEKFFLVDEDGYILGIVDPKQTNLPKVTYNGELQVGIFIEKSLVPLYLVFLTTIDEQNLFASSVSVNNKELSFYLKDSVFARIGREKNIRKSVLIIAELLKQQNISGKLIKRIDLRYDKVIVEYE